MYLKNSHSRRDLPDAGLADHGYQAARPSAARSPAAMIVCELALAADERRLQAGAAPCAAGPGHHAQRRPGMDRLIAALDLMLSGVLVGDRRLRGPPRHVVHQHRPRRGERLQPRAVLTVSPSTIPSPSAPTSTAALPVSTPARTRRSGIPTSWPSAVTA